MGSCTTNRSIKETNNPIQMILEMYTIDDLKNKWDPQQLSMIYEKVNAKKLNDAQFLKLFPKIKEYPQTTKKKIINLFKTVQDDKIRRDQLFSRLTLIQKSEDPQLMGIIFYYLYSTHYNNTMSQNNFRLFRSENSSHISNKVINSQLLTKWQQLNVIHRQQFLQIFSYYNFESFKSLFQFDFDSIEQEIINQLLRLNPIVRSDGDTVNLISCQWFKQWKNYILNEYGYDIMVSKSQIRIQQKKVQKKKSIKRPGLIKNNHLKGQYHDTLNKDLKETNDYFLVPHWMWKKLFQIYKGGPAFKRQYPDIYLLKIITVEVDQNGKFIPNQSKDQTFLDHRGMLIQDFAPKKVTADKYYCYYRYPGKLDWTKINSITKRISQYIKHNRTYLCFVNRQIQKKFQERYCCIQKNGTQYVKQRVKNYGSIINYQYKGRIIKGQVTKIKTNGQIIIQSADPDGIILRHRKYTQDVQKYNPSQINIAGNVNALAGLNNLGNTCYINSVIQCLLKTPYFGKYLIQFNYQGKDKSQLLIYALTKIYNKGKKSNQVIDTSNLKSIIDKNFPYFKGFLQQDAQQFLGSLLNKISQQIRDNKKQLNKNDIVNSTINFNQMLSQSRDLSKSKQQINLNQTNRNNKVFKFFSGEIQVINKCINCQKQSIKKQSFFTYSISLPQYSERQFYFTMIKIGNHSPVKYGVNVNKKTKISQLIQLISKYTNIPQPNLCLTQVFCGEIIHIFTIGDMEKQFYNFINKNTAFICYQLKSITEPTLQDYLSNQLKDKSVKLQVRQRRFHQKTNRFQNFLLPYLIEIGQNTLWSDLASNIAQKLSIYFDQKYLTTTDERNDQNDQKTSFQEFLYENVDLSQKKRQTYSQVDLDVGKKTQNPQKDFSMKDIPYKQTRNSMANLSGNIYFPYEIRLISKYPSLCNQCLICKKPFRSLQKNSKKQLINPTSMKTQILTDVGQKIQSKQNLNNQDKFCNQCQYSNDKPLLMKLSFRNRYDTMIIVIDWKDSLSVKGPQMKFDSSYYNVLNTSKKRQDNLTDLIDKNIQNKQKLELKCENQGCQGNQIYRKQKISVLPNIFIIHLKRFRYTDNQLIKLTNIVSYDEKANFMGQNYSLYGVVAHRGSGGGGGHYISYVKTDHNWYVCDDDKVKICQLQSFICPDAYILFYVKKGIETSLISFSF